MRSGNVCVSVCVCVRICVVCAYMCCMCVPAVEMMCDGVVCHVDSGVRQTLYHPLLVPRELGPKPWGTRSHVN